MWSSIPACCALLALAAAPDSAPTRYEPRKDYGVRLEPAGSILHGAGQTWPSEPLNSAFDRYSKLMADRNARPVVFMDYNGPGTPQSFYDALKTRLDALEANGQYVLPQLGFHLPSGDNTMTSAQLDALSAGLKSLGRPVYLRIGYEMNGAWYDPRYEPEPYIREFRRVADHLRRDKVPFASLWNMCPGWDSDGGSGGTYGTWKYMAPFYPGDDYVDWFSMDLFSVTDITNPHTAEFLARADAHGKPVIIGEATPRYVGAGDAPDWDTWFEPFFNLIRENPGIKGHTYINWDWASTRWPDWGDGRLEPPHGHPTVRARYLEELANPVYLHATSGPPAFVR